MSYMQPFAPWQAGANLANGIVIATSTAPASAQIRTPTASTGTGIPTTYLGNIPICLLISNFANGWLFFNLGQASTLTAAAVPVATNIPICAVPPNSQCSFLCDPQVQYISVIINTGTGVCIVNLGEGM